MALSVFSVNRRLLLISSSAVLLLLLLYVLVLPALLASTYKSSVEKTQQQLSAKMEAVYATFSLGAYAQDKVGALPDEATLTEYNAVFDQNEADYQQTQTVLEQAQAALDQDSRKLEGFVNLPLLGWNRRYHQATEAARDEKHYLVEARTYLAEYRNTVSYGISDIAIDRQFYAAVDSLKRTNISLLGTVATGLGKYADQINIEIAELKVLPPPTDLRDARDATLRRGQTHADQLREMATAIRKLDVAKVNQLSDTLDAEKKTTKTEASAVFQKLRSSSGLTKRIDRLRSLQQRIASSLGSI